MYPHRYLLDRGANVNAVTQTGGDTALTYACENGHTNVAEVLLDRGAALVRRRGGLYYRVGYDPHPVVYLYIR